MFYAVAASVAASVAAEYLRQPTTLFAAAMQLAQK